MKLDKSLYIKLDDIQFKNWKRWSAKRTFYSTIAWSDWKGKS